MKLNEGKVGCTYLVEGVAVDEALTRRLAALGVNEMTPLMILNKKEAAPSFSKCEALVWRWEDGLVMAYWSGKVKTERFRQTA